MKFFTRERGKEIKPKRLNNGSPPFLFAKRLSVKCRMSAARDFCVRQGATPELVETSDQGATKLEAKRLAALGGSFHSIDMVAN
ncbi:MAG: hypothetical protein ACSHX7_08890 [Luteolibacter sp.]